MVSVFYLKLQYYMLDTIRYCITLPYSVLFFFVCGYFGFVPYTYTSYRGDVCYVKMLGYERRGDVGDAVE